MGNVGEDNVGDSKEGVDKGDFGGDVVLNIIGGLDSNGDHGNKSGDQDTDSRNDRHVEYLSRCAWQCANTAKDQADDTKNDGAGTVVGNGVEQHGEGEDVTGHQEDNEQQLAHEGNLSADGTQKEFTSITHTVYLRETQFKLTHDISGIP